MTTVLRIGGLNVRIYSNDHRPAHVHVVGSGNEAIFHLHCPHGPSELRENYGYGRREIGRIRKLLDERIGHLCGEWGRVHGDF